LFSKLNFHTFGLMILKSIIKSVIDDQRQYIDNKDTGLPRELSWDLPRTKSHALIITGIRRCGKSTLLHQFIKKADGRSLFLNFDDPRLFGFSLNDFDRLREIINAESLEYLFFDEIQLVDNWERFIRYLIDLQHYKIALTGSNAGILNKELGTHLTGRHISKELFPFSFSEYLLFKGIPSSKKATEDFLQIGGFPEYVKTENPDILTSVLKDILYRDISVRYGVRNHKAIELLAIHLLSNLGKPITSNSLRTIFGVAAASTISEYLHFFEETYLFSFLNKFSYSHKAQIQNPRKTYTIDTGLARQNSVSFSEDQGRMLENAVHLGLRRNGQKIQYFAGKGECDFVCIEKGKVKKLIQVSYTIHADNIDRELNGLFEAMDFFKLSKGEIVTLDQEDKVTDSRGTIEIRPFHLKKESQK